MPVDVDADGAQDRMVARDIGGQRTFIVLRSSDSQAVFFPWGTATDALLTGDYDGDGKTDFVARRDQGGQLVWYILLSATGQLRVVFWGLPSDM
jgi:hypothetical protein